MIDIGGGSTEFVVGEGGEVVFHVSTQTGAVRQTERHVRTDPPAAGGARRRCAPRSARSSTPSPGRASARRTRAAIAVAGHGDLARRDRPETRAVRPRRASTGYVLTLDASRDAALEMLAGMTDAQRREVPGLHPDRAPTIVAGAITWSRRCGPSASMRSRSPSTTSSAAPLGSGASRALTTRAERRAPASRRRRRGAIAAPIGPRGAEPRSESHRHFCGRLWTNVRLLRRSGGAETDLAGKGVIVPKGVVVPAPAS